MSAHVALIVPATDHWVCAATNSNGRPRAGNCVRDRLNGLLQGFFIDLVFEQIRGLLRVATSRKLALARPPVTYVDEAMEQRPLSSSAYDLPVKRVFNVLAECTDSSRHAYPI